jgi:DNA-binding beta-propeller fold protein YncE
MANGNMKPRRIIAGLATKLGRTVHGLAYNPLHDEIIVPNPLADAILVFRGDADGAEAPIRVIQGACTRLLTPHAVSFDPAHQEILVASLTGKTIYVFPWNASGNVAPTRMIRGPNTKLGHVVSLGVDPGHDLLAVANTRDILIFKRTDDGDVAPTASIAGPKTGIEDEPWGLQVSNGKIFLAASNHLHQNLYAGCIPKGTYDKVPEDPWLNPNLGFIGVWEITDKGDIAPRMKIGGPFSGLYHPTGLALNPKNGEIYVSDSVRNGILSFLTPDFFEGEKMKDRNQEVKAWLSPALRHREK